MKRTNLLLLFYCILLSGFTFSQEHFLKDDAYREKVINRFEEQKRLCHNKEDRLFNVLAECKNAKEKEALMFLYAYMPLSDLANYDGEYFLELVRYSFKAKDEFPWGRKIPDDIFRHFVLPYRVNNENPDTARFVFFNELKKRVKNMSMYNAALEVNHWCHEKVTYKSTDSRTISPLGAVCSAFGRCGEESTFLVTALRSVGLPARQVYVPRWAHCDDNHAWVEVWADGKWYYMGACEPDAELNMGWFTEPARRAMLVDTKVFGDYNGSELQISKTDYFSFINTLPTYADTKKLFVKVFDSENIPVQNADVEYKLYNYAEFFPLAKLKSDKNGLSSLVTGLGDLLVWVSKGNDFGYSKVTVEKTDTVVVALNKKAGLEYTEEYDFVPPIEKAPYKVSEEGKEKNSQRLKAEDAIRAKYEATFIDSVSVVSLAEKNGISKDTLWYFIKKSRGNWKNLAAFIEAIPTAHKKWIIPLLSNVSEKDLRDTPCEVFIDQVLNSGKFANTDVMNNDSLFSAYVLSPRVDLELITAYKGYLQKQFGNAFAAECNKDISVITKWIKENIRIDDNANYARVPLTPVGTFDLKVADRNSRNIFFVALCRSMGIPARFEPATYKIQYYKNGWNDVNIDVAVQDSNIKGYLLLKNESANKNPEYYTHYTIAKFRDGKYETLDYEYDGGKSILNCKTALDAGNYMLVTGNRLTNGTVLAGITFFNIPENATKTVLLDFRKSQSKPVVYGKIDLTETLKQKDGNSKVKLKDITGDKGALLIWIEPDKEPTKHVMADLHALKEKLEASGSSVSIIYPENFIHTSLAKEIMENLPMQTKYYTDSNNKLLKNAEQITGTVSGNYPVVVLLNSSGEVVYCSMGYKIGVGEQITKCILQMQSSCSR